MSATSAAANAQCLPQCGVLFKNPGRHRLLAGRLKPMPGFAPQGSTGGIVALDFASNPKCRSWVNGTRGRRSIVAARAVQQISPELSEDAPSPGPLDDFFLKLFREKLIEEAAWDSPKAGYEGLLEVVKHLYTKSSKPETEKATIRVFKALLPGWLVLSFRKMILPIAEGKVAAILMAFVTQVTCQWLMGPCTVNQVTLADGSSLPSGVLVQRCKFLEGSKCAGICTHTCKIPTQTFIKDVMGTPLAMEPNFNDFSCQFKYGVEAVPRDQDPGLQTPCLSICPTAMARSALRPEADTNQCPQVQ